MIEIDDFVMLGTTVPEPTRSGRTFVCSAGYSAQLGQFMRVYPLSRRHIPRRWHIHRVRLERPGRQDDSRPESWKVHGDRSPGAHESINDQFVDLGVIDEARRAATLSHLIEPSIAVLNERRASLGIVVPKSARVEFDQVADHPDSPLLQLFDMRADHLDESGKRFPIIPRLRFTDLGGEHRLMLRDWGVYELLRKNGPEYLFDHLRGALHLNEASALLVGNLNHQRNAWLVISVLNGLFAPKLALEFA